MREVVTGEKTVSGRSSSKCFPEAGGCLVWLRRSKEASLAEVEEGGENEARVAGRQVMKGFLKSYYFDLYRGNLQKILTYTLQKSLWSLS